MANELELKVLEKAKGWLGEQYLIYQVYKGKKK